MKYWYVYIMANKPNGVIYIGVTDNIDERIKEHKLKLHPKAFTTRYNCDKLVFTLKNLKMEKKPRLEKNDLRNGKEIGKLN